MANGRRNPLRRAKRSLPRRITALFWALVFVLGTVDEGFGLHPCPHHDGGAHAAPADHAGHHPAPAASANAAAGEHAGHHTSAAVGPHCEQVSAATTADPASAPGDSHDGPCTCGGACQAGPGIALPALPQSQPTTRSISAAEPVVPAATDLPRQRPPHFLPFSLAPPRLG